MTHRPNRAGLWLHRHLGRRGEFLLCLAGVDLTYALSMVTAAPPAINANATFNWFSTIAPIRAWAVLWVVVGLICAYHAFRRHDRLGFGAAIGIKMLWGLVSLNGYLVDNVSIGSVGIWLGMAGIVWRISGWREPEPDGEDEA